MSFRGARGQGTPELSGVSENLFANKKVCLPNELGKQRLKNLIKLKKRPFREVF